MGKSFRNDLDSVEYSGKKENHRSFNGHRKIKGMIANHGSKEGRRINSEDAKERQNHQ